jgi:hypothetical protein
LETTWDTTSAGAGKARSPVGQTPVTGCVKIAGADPDRRALSSSCKSARNRTRYAEEHVDDTTTVELIWDDQTNTKALDPAKNLLKKVTAQDEISLETSSIGRE